MVPGVVPLLVLLVSAELLDSITSGGLSPAVVSLQMAIFIALYISGGMPMVLSVVLPCPVSLLLLVVV